MSKIKIFSLLVAFGICGPSLSWSQQESYHWCHSSGRDYQDSSMGPSYSSGYYQRVYDRCGDSVSRLRKARARSSRILQKRGVGPANRILFDQLFAEYKNLKEYRTLAPPHTLVAILEGYKVANIYQAHLPQMLPINDPNNIPLDLAYHRFMTQLYDVIIWAREHLDRPHYHRYCIAGRYCGDQGWKYNGDYDDAYYHGMEKLTHNFLNMLQKVRRTARTNQLEFILTAAMAESSAYILDKSPYAREMQCKIEEILDVSDLATRSACGWTYPDVSEVRYEVDALVQALGSSRKRSRHGYNPHRECY